MRFQRYDEIVTDHSTPTSPSDVTPPDRSWRILRTARRILRAAAWLLAAVLLLLAVSFLSFRFILLPNLDRLRPYLEQSLGEASGMAIKVGRIDGEWLWWAPVLTLRDVQVRPVSRASAIRLSRVEMIPAWKSWLYLEPRLASLQLDDLQLALQRDRQGRLSLNGIALSGGKGDNRLLDWLLRQDSITLSLKQLSWHDQLLALPELRLEGLTLQLQDNWRGHRLQLHGRPDSPLLPGLLLDAGWQGGAVADWRQWQGELTLAAGSGELSLLKRYWPTAPFAGQGRASSRLTAAFAEGRITALQGRWQVDDVSLALQRRDLPLPRLAGELDYRSAAAGEHQLQASHLTLSGEFGPLLRDATVDAKWHEQRGGRVQLSGVSLAGLWPVLQQRISALRELPLTALDGELRNTSWQWQGPWRAPRDYRLSTAFRQLRPTLSTSPTVQGGVNGELKLARDGGELSLSGQGLTLAWPQQLAEPLALQQLAGQLRWQRQGQGWQFTLPALRLQTPDLKAELSGDGQLPAQGALQGRLDVRVPQVAVARVSRYLPAVIGRSTLDWLDMALVGGTARNVTARVEGDFSRFPFGNDAGGRFDVDAEVAGGVLRFDRAWPDITAIDGKFAMRNDHVLVDAATARTAGVALQAVKVRLPDLMTQPARLLIDGQARGALPQMLAYTRSSPVDGWLGGFLSTIDSQGEAALKLGLDIPLSALLQSKVRGEVSLPGNSLQFRQLPLPPLQEVRGVLQFNERGVSSPGIGFAAFGGQGRLTSTQRRDDVMQFAVQGDAAITPVLQQYVPLLSPLVSGRTPYQANFDISNNLDDLQLLLSLRGVAIQAPAPLAKPADAEWPLQLRLRPTLQGWQLAWQQQERAQGTVTLDSHGNLRGVGVGVGAEVPASPQQIGIAIRQPQLDLLPWLGVVQQLGTVISTGGGTAEGAGLPLQLQLATPLLQLGSYRLHDVDSRLDWRGGDAPLQLQLDSREAAGQLRYRAADGGRVQAELSRLTLPLQEDSAAVAAGGSSAGTLLADVSVPALELAVAQLFWEQHQLGQLTLLAQPRGEQWQLDKVTLQMPEGRMQVTGVAPREGSRQPQTRVDVAFDTENAGGVLTRFGIADALYGGRGRLDGQLTWPGRLHDFELARLGGQLRLDVRDGRFAQVNPGVARLLGILSLQSLSRRIRLDFTDVFSSGFAFDAITGSAIVRDGVFASDDVRMTGPAAQVTLRGEADLPRNQQNVRARITPHISESVSLLAGATLVNPLLGAATLLTQKILQDPINQVFSFEYQISGSLTDPQVSKVGENVTPVPPAKTP
nr:YhdP family protein [Vogesella sp. AC12]